MPPAIDNDAESYSSDDDAVNAFLKRHNITESEDAPKPSEDDSVDEDTTEPEGETEDTEESSDDNDPDDNEGDEGEPEDTEDKPKKKVVIEPDADAYVVHKVDGKDVEIKVSDLTRLYGQEASLTRKSQEVAQLRTRTEEVATKYATGLDEMLKRAKDRWEPYSQINWVALTKDPNVSSDELQALHSEAQKVWDDVQYFSTSLDKAHSDLQATRQEELRTKGQEAWKVLSDPKTGIKGWNEQMYKDISSFAITEGLSEDIVSTIVDPVAFKLLHRAMMYTKGQQASTQTKAVNKTPKRILKETPEPVSKSIKSSRPDKAELKFKQSGSLDDGVEALLARWSKAN